MKKPSFKEIAIKAHEAKDYDKALESYAQHLAIYPNDAAALSNLGTIYRNKKMYKMAEHAQARAYAIDPGALSVMVNYANILSDLGQFERSAELRHKILKRKPNDPEQLSLIGKCYRGMGDYDRAINHLNAAEKLWPDYEDIRMQRAFAELADYRYQDALESYKARWETNDLEKASLPVPQWDGQDLAGKTVVVYPEQGFGDYILMSRFIPDLKAVAAKVNVIVKKPLYRLMQNAEAADLVTTNMLEAVKDADYWLPIMDLARINLKTKKDIRLPIRLSIPEQSRQRAQVMIGPYNKVFKVGVVWSGSATYKGNGFRSFLHTDFLPLTDMPGVQLFSLYKGPFLDAYYQDGTFLKMPDMASTDSDFADCAAMMEQMDLIITSDTATAHIAGSMGLKTWVILHMDPFWVYRNGADPHSTDWYPSMRLFRQEKALEWAPVMENVKQALQKEVSV